MIFRLSQKSILVYHGIEHKKENRETGKKGTYVRFHFNDAFVKKSEITRFVISSKARNLGYSIG
jgi:hypothetical protein